MAGTHRIDVEFFHNADIFYHILFGHHIALVGIHLVTVGPFDEDGLPVDKHLGAHYFHGTETDFERSGLRRFAFAQHGNFQAIEVGGLGTPKSGMSDGFIGTNHAIAGLGLLIAFDREGSGQHDAAVRSGEFQLQGTHTGGHFSLEIKVTVHRSDIFHIFHAGFRPGIHKGLAGQTGQTPEILALQISTVAPPLDFQTELVVSDLDILGDIETGFEFAVFAVTDFLAIDKDAHIGGGGADAQENILSFPRRVNRDDAAILAHIIVLIGNNRRRVGEMPVPRIFVVGVHRIDITGKLPQSGNLHRFPTFPFLLRESGETFAGDILAIGKETKIPNTVQADIVTVGKERGTHRKAVLLNQSGILPISKFGRCGSRQYQTEKQRRDEQN